ncbi:M24 family metallopeptidase [Halovivax cerinus]|uniref:M24 family metallopeptidase n=1 Tax=Halovivax cerinus TaxID=1487865 RepID=A0ABD5NQ45_9EURY|nr:Xaa-Pro peptidase family protein [Halovivax cerinus]
MLSENRLTERLEADDVDVVVTSSPENVFYLSGLESLSQDLLGERAFAIRTADGGDPIVVLPAVDASIVADTGLEYEAVYTYGSFYLYESDGMRDIDRTVQALKNERNLEGPVDALLAALDSLVEGDDAVAIERSGFDADEYGRVTDALDVDEIRPAAPICRDLRRVKSTEEQRRLRRSVEINQASIRAAIETVEAGMTERELASRYQQELVSRGAEPLFTVIGFGPHGAYPHAVPGDRELEPGDLVRFDVGCTYENYASDIARTFAFERATDVQRRKYDVLNRSMDRSIDLLEDGATTTAVFDGTIEFVRTEGADVFESFDRNHFGHGIGIEVYDPPTIDRATNRIHAGMVLCVEPPYYQLGMGGIQVEDEVVVTEDGVTRLSDCPDTLRVI